MPRTTKEKAKEIEVGEPKKKKSTKSVASKKTAEKKAEKTTTKKAVAKKDTKIDKKVSKNEKKDEEKKSLKKETKSKKETPKKASSKKTVAKSTATKKTSTQKKAAGAKKSKSISSSRKATKTSVQSFIPEYYDLPYKYNQTVVKLLAQTPKKLFIYWEISDDDRKAFIEKYGDYFFNDTKPVIIIHNLSKNYSFEIDINDFANCWYIDIPDPDCLYDIELGRRPITFNDKIQTPYIYISSSNDLQAPNNHILFENIHPDTILDFKNTKTKQISKRAIINLSFLNDINAIYGLNGLYQFYKKLYGEDLLKELADTRLNNPSSGAISSFK